MKFFVLLLFALISNVLGGVIEGKVEETLSKNKINAVQQELEPKKSFVNTITGKNLESKTVPSPKIIGGSDTRPEDVPWQAAIFFFPDYFYCGGFLVRPCWVVTSASCISGMDDVRVVLGAYDIYDSSEPTRQEFNSSSLYIHPKYSYEHFLFDVGLIYIGPSGAKITPFVDLLHLPTEHDFENNLRFAMESAQICGWGISNDVTWETTPYLQCTNLTTIENRECGEYYGVNYVFETTICTSSSATNGVCYGDGGGPLVIYEDHKYKAIGISIFVGYSCLYNPNGFTRMTSVMHWIDTMMCETKFPCENC